MNPTLMLLESERTLDGDTAGDALRVAQYRGCLAASPRACLFVDALDDYRVAFANAAAHTSLEVLRPHLRRAPAPMAGAWLEDWFDVPAFATATLRALHREPFVGQVRVGSEVLDAYAAPVLAEEGSGRPPGEVLGLFVVWSVVTARASVLEDVARSTADVRAAIESIGERAAEAVGVVEEAVTFAGEATSVLAGLEAATLEIEQVLGVIATIAEQTNLLALNATIEAARAGELGKGFAVVATEVKELAQSTAQATGDVEERIRRVVEGAGAASAALASITDVVGRIDELQHHIAGSVGEQRSSTDRLHEAVVAALG